MSPSIQGQGHCGWILVVTELFNITVNYFLQTNLLVVAELVLSGTQWKCLQIVLCIVSVNSYKHWSNKIQSHFIMKYLIVQLLQCDFLQSVFCGRNGSYVSQESFRPKGFSTNSRFRNLIQF